MSGGSIILDQYADRLKRKRRSVYSIRNFDAVARQFERWLQGQGLTAETCGFEDIEDYIDGLVLSPNSKGQHLRWIQAAYNYAIRRGTIRHNPALDVDVPAEPDTEPRIIAPRELRAIKAEVWRDKDWMLFHLLAYTGMRRKEIAELRWEAVSIPDETIRVIGKGGKLRLVPIHPALGELFVAGGDTEYVLSSRGKNGTELGWLNQMARRLHPVYTPHDYRRTVATNLRRNGVDTGVIDRIMGWAPRSIFRRYYDNVADHELKRAILRLYADDPL